MAVTAYGYDSSTIKARPDFSAAKDAKGAWNARNSFTMLRGTWENFAHTLFYKGAIITDIYTELGSYWSFLALDEFDVRHQPGGITEVDCTWVGAKEEEGELIYTLSGTRVERPITDHPLWKQEMVRGIDNVEERNIILQALRGVWEMHPETVPEEEKFVFQNQSMFVDDYEMHRKVPVKWARMIFELGHRTFMAPTLQWTEEKSSKTGWKDRDLNNFALKEFDETNRPPGNPPMPINGGFEWMRVGMNQTTTSGVTTQSRTWELSVAGGFPRFPAPFEKEGLYDYELDEIDGNLPTIRIAVGAVGL